MGKASSVRGFFLFKLEESLERLCFAIAKICYKVNSKIISSGYDIPIGAIYMGKLSPNLAAHYIMNELAETAAQNIWQKMRNAKSPIALSRLNRELQRRQAECRTNWDIFWLELEKTLDLEMYPNYQLSVAEGGIIFLMDSPYPDDGDDESDFNDGPPSLPSKEKVNETVKRLLTK